MFSWIEEHFEKYFLIVTLAIMVLIIFFQVVLRTFGTSLVWAEELSRYIMLYQIWVGAAYAVKEDAHIRITSLIDRYRGKSNTRFSVVVYVVWLIFAMWLFVEGIFLVSEISKMGQTSPAMQIPMTIPYASVPIGGFLMSLRLIQKLKGYFVSLEKEVE